jgi:hypothetical protein
MLTITNVAMPQNFNIIADNLLHNLCREMDPYIV